MSQQEAERIGEALDNVLGEFLDGYAFIGFHAVTGEPITVSRSNDAKTTAALNQVLANTTIKFMAHPDASQEA